jgi:hypothetical protein
MTFPGQAVKQADCTVATSPTKNPGSLKGAGDTSAKRASISQVMMVVALTAVNLAMLRATPVEIVTFPSVWVVLGMIDFVILWKLILTRSFRAFHYTFMVVFVIAYFVMALVVTTERFLPLGLLVRAYQQLAGEHANVISPGNFWFDEVWFAALLSFSMAWGLGLGAAWLERRQNWDIAAFFRGALVGFGTAVLLLTLADVAARGGIVAFARLSVRLVVLAVCLILGGRMGLSRLKSSTSDREDRSGNTGLSP